MKRQKYTHKKDEALKSGVVFCAECGEDLEKFGVTNGKIDVAKIKARHKNCRDTGKFKGDKCAMLFIADDEALALPPDEDD
jgi:hypothetical protein